jgi:hypothetical protein
VPLLGPVNRPPTELGFAVGYSSAWRRPERLSWRRRFCFGSGLTAEEPQVLHRGLFSGPQHAEAEENARTQPVGSLIEAGSAKWDRFRIPFSDHHRGLHTAHVIPDRGEQGKQRLGIIYPADHTRPERTCGSCALCINSTVPIVLKAH